MNTTFYKALKILNEVGATDRKVRAAIRDQVHR
jgi:hypothetical protein